MAKPIVLMYLPMGDDILVAHKSARELMQILNGYYGKPKADEKIICPEYWTDYYWLVFPKDEITEPELQVFYEKDFTPIKFEELKKFIEDTFKAKDDQP